MGCSQMKYTELSLEGEVRRWQVKVAFETTWKEVRKTQLNVNAGDAGSGKFEVKPPGDAVRTRKWIS